MSKYLDSSTRYTVGFAHEVVDRIHLESFWSEESFADYVMSGDLDYEMDPVEDYFIIKMYFNGDEVKQIASFLERKVRAVCLRLRMFLDVRNELVFNKVSSNREGIDFIVKGFFERAKSFLYFCHMKLVDHDIMETFNICDPNQILVKRILTKKIVWVLT